MWLKADGTPHWASWSQLFDIFIHSWIMFLRSLFKEVFSIKMQQNSLRIFLRRSFKLVETFTERHFWANSTKQTSSRGDVCWLQQVLQVHHVLNWSLDGLEINLLLCKTFSHFSWAIMTVCGHVFSHRNLQCKAEQHPGLDGGWRRLRWMQLSSVMLFCVCSQSDNWKGWRVLISMPDLSQTVSFFTGDLGWKQAWRQLPSLS